jgi:short-subunit dehydrogenase
MRSRRDVAIVTGASSGIGRALAVRLASDGNRVGLIARRGELLESLNGEIAAAGGTAAAAVADVGDRAALRGAIADIEGRLGPTDVMVANAGFGAPTRIDPLNIEDVEQTFRVNLMGVIYAIEAVLPGMLARRRGQLLAVSSMAGDKGLPGESAYCASKAAVNVYLEGLRIALRGTGVVVTTVCPGFVQTPMAPMDAALTPFVMTAEAAAARIARLIARRRGGVHRFPRRMAILMAMVARLPDAVVARLVRAEGEPRPDPAPAEPRR